MGCDCMKEKICTFCGHRLVFDSDTADRVYTILSDLIKTENYNAFYSGGMGEFDEICESAVQKLKQEYPHIKLYRVIYKYKPNLDAIKELVDDIILPELDEFHYKELIIKRNQWMIDSADAVLCYVRRESGGAYKTMKCAEKIGKRLINV